MLVLVTGCDVHSFFISTMVLNDFTVKKSDFPKHHRQQKKKTGAYFSKFKISKNKHHSTVAKISQILAKHHFFKKSLKSFRSYLLHND